MVVVVLGWGGCQSHSAPKIQRREVHKVEEKKQADDQEVEVSWPTQVGNLKQSIASFRSLSQCRRDVQNKLLPEVAEALSDLRYDAFIEDVCKGLLALKTGSLEACKGLSVSAAQDGCMRRLALLKGNPAACPQARLVEGRDPLCLAWATRRLALCNSLGSQEQVLCRAVLRHAKADCNRLEGAAAAHCRVLTKRYGPLLEDVIQDEQQETHQLKVDGKWPQTTGREFHSKDTTVERGVHLKAVGCKYRVELGDTRVLSVADFGQIKYSPRTRLHFAVDPQQPAPQRQRFAPPDAGVKVAVSPTEEYASLDATAGFIELQTFTPQRGAKVAGKFEATLSQVGQILKIEGQFSTFVRDLDALPTYCK